VGRHAERRRAARLARRRDGLGVPRIEGAGERRLDLPVQTLKRIVLFAADRGSSKHEKKKEKKKKLLITIII
jgi:hypothetical protein